MRGTKRKGTRYFGPYGHAYAIRETLDLLLRTFPIRTCSDNKFGRHERLGRPCLLFHIEKCSGPCVGEISKADYDLLVDELIDFLDGETDTIVKRLEARDAGRQRRARVRAGRAPPRPPRLGAQGHREAADGRRQGRGHRRHRHRATTTSRRRCRCSSCGKGRVVGRKGFVVDKVEDLTEGELVDRVLEGLYDDPPPLGVPKQVLVPVESAEPELYEEWLTEQRGSKVVVRVPQRGDKRELHGDGHPQRRRGVHPPPAAAGGRPQHPGQGAQRAAGRTSVCPRPRCASSATT